ncbi:MAG: hypothetical protein RMI35_00810 [Leptospiraceae bacterium]|nr:hypothetical protein [Leptospiraceae bacterium]
MNLKVIHLIRKLERIERDIEEIQNMLNTLPSDREYFPKLKDSLLDEYHRLNQLKKEIYKQTVYIPETHREFLVNLFPEEEKQPQQSIEITFEVSTSQNQQETPKTHPQPDHQAKQAQNQELQEPKENTKNKDDKEIKEKKARKDDKTIKRSNFIFKLD